jgi:hypothetical protein
VHSRLPKTAVCVLRIEDRGPGAVLITVTTTLDITVASRGNSRSVASYDDALSLVARFLREHASGKNPGQLIS